MILDCAALTRRSTIAREGCMGLLVDDHVDSSRMRAGASGECDRIAIGSRLAEVAASAQARGLELLAVLRAEIWRWVVGSI